MKTETLYFINGSSNESKSPAEAGPMPNPSRLSPLGISKNIVSPLDAYVKGLIWEL